MNKLITYWTGVLRLWRNRCPLCNSSPPEQNCRVCDGTELFGDRLSERHKRMWRARFEIMMEEK